MARHWLPLNLPRKLLRPLKRVALEHHRGLVVEKFGFGNFARHVAEDFARIVAASIVAVSRARLDFLRAEFGLRLVAIAL